jgi:uncharacterized damage-inducible protein DinB
MTVTAFPKLVDHTYWALDRVLDQLELVDPAALEADPPAAGLATALDTVRHTYGYDRFWIPQILGIEAPARPPKDIAELRRVWEPTRQALRDYLEESDDDVLAQQLEVRDNSGETFRPRVGDVLSQFVQHHSQHRAELAVMATVHGHSPGELDWWDYMEHLEAAD